MIVVFFLTDLEWKIIYVGSAESEEYDQTLDSVVVGPIIAGKHMFVFEVGILTMLYRTMNYTIFWFNVKRLVHLIHQGYLGKMQSVSLWCYSPARTSLGNSSESVTT